MSFYIQGRQGTLQHAAGFRKLARWLRSANVEIIVMEATGGLETPLFNALQRAEYSVA
ncbi:hypothetical protein [Paenirhodobacter populi]|uniref:hypothetical protein n=1 Tax=Paenirhodobacter populi TaxID=2306993 RepID=UPI0013E3555F|nr:hypothetical protein [Sinirhodobacter populi]